MGATKRVGLGCSSWCTKRRSLRVAIRVRPILSHGASNLRSIIGCTEKRYESSQYLAIFLKMKGRVVNCSNTLLRKGLSKIISTQGPPLCFSVPLCEIQLQALAVEHGEKVSLLVQAVACETVSELLRLHRKVNHLILLPKLAHYLRRRTPGLSEYDSHWVMETWAMALNIIPVCFDAADPDLRAESSASEEGNSEGHSILMRSIAFSPDGKTMVSAGWDQTLRLWDVKENKPLRVMGDPVSVSDLATDRGADFPQMYHCAVFHPDGQTIAAGAQDGTVRFRRVADGKELSVVQAHQGEIWALEYSHDGKYLASGGTDRCVCLWNAQPMHKPCWKLAHGGAIQSVAFSPDGRVLATACNDGLVRLLEVETGKQIGVLIGHKSSVRSVAFSPDGKTLASGGTDGTVRLWDWESGKQGRRLELPTTDGDDNWAMSIVFCSGGEVIAASCQDGRVLGWHVDSGECFHSVKYQSSIIWAIAASPDGKTLAITGKHQPIILSFTEGEGR